MRLHCWFYTPLGVLQFPGLFSWNSIAHWPLVYWDKSVPTLGKICRALIKSDIGENLIVSCLVPLKAYLVMIDLCVIHVSMATFQCDSISIFFPNVK